MDRLAKDGLMAARERDKVLDVLRSISEPGKKAPEARPSPAPPPRDGDKRIEIGMEEAGLFFFAAMVLVVAAFLMGWYGRGFAPAGPVRAEIEPAVAQVGGPDADLTERSSGIERARGESRSVYSIMVAKFPRAGAAEAEDHRLFLAQQGYPAELRRTAEGFELCVGAFDAPGDRLAREWLPKLQAISPAYSSARVVRLAR